MDKVLLKKAISIVLPVVPGFMDGLMSMLFPAHLASFCSGLL